MIRWATEADRAALIAVMRAAKDAAPHYDYATMDGTVLVDDHQGVLRGYIRFFLGRPETWVRGWGVAPAYQHTGLVARRLLLALLMLAIEHGSQGIEGFHHATKPGVVDIMRRLGAELHAGQRSRFLIRPETVARWAPAPREMAHVC